ncbi:MAG: hypothetical protein WBM69_26150 [Desulfobacterales bacterium]
MRDWAIKLGKRISEYFSTRCNTENKLLNQDYRPSSQTRLLGLAGSAAEQVIVSFLNSGLGPSNDYIQ